jgi:thiol-disulfide isomerase/thioredoxin
MYHQKNLEIFKYIVIVLIFFISIFKENNLCQTKINQITLDELKGMISKREGKPILINFWASWCAPCREEFPDLVKIADKYKIKLDFVGISVDYPDEIESKILPFVKEQNASFPIYVSKVSEQEKMIDFFDTNWNGAIPATFIYNSKGGKVINIYGKKDFKYFDELIKNLNN